MKLFTQDHPECAIDEIYLGNVEKAEFQTDYQTYRFGSMAYCVDGSPMPFNKEHGVFPLFVKLVEYQKVQRETVFHS